VKTIVTLSCVTLLLGAGLTARALETTDTEALYRKKCALCHGDDGQPKTIAKEAPAFKDEKWKEQTSVEEMKKVILEGKGKMPKFEGKLSDEEVAALVEYVRSM